MIESTETEIIPLVCEVERCSEIIATWCPLCDTFLCDTHDELIAYRGHDCLSSNSHSFELADA